MTTAAIRAFLADRLALLEDRIRAACGRAGRPRSAVTLVAVTKSVGPTAATILTELGVLDLGESRPQELWHKAEPLPPAVRWHLIGHLAAQQGRADVAAGLPASIRSTASGCWTRSRAEAGIQGRPLDVAAGSQRQPGGEQDWIHPGRRPRTGAHLVALRACPRPWPDDDGGADERPEEARPDLRRAAAAPRPDAERSRKPAQPRTPVDGHDQRFRGRHRRRGDVDPRRQRASSTACPVGATSDRS